MLCALMASLTSKIYIKVDYMPMLKTSRSYYQDSEQLNAIAIGLTR